MFGCGTASVVVPVGKIVYHNRFVHSCHDLQYGNAHLKITRLHQKIDIKMVTISIFSGRQLVTRSGTFQRWNRNRIWCRDCTITSTAFSMGDLIGLSGRLMCRTKTSYSMQAIVWERRDVIFDICKFMIFFILYLYLIVDERRLCESYRSCEHLKL